MRFWAAVVGSDFGLSWAKALAVVANSNSNRPAAATKIVIDLGFNVVFLLEWIADTYGVNFAPALHSDVAQGAIEPCTGLPVDIFVP